MRVQKQKNYCANSVIYGSNNTSSIWKKKLATQRERERQPIVAIQITPADYPRATPASNDLCWPLSLLMDVQIERERQTDREKDRDNLIIVAHEADQSNHDLRQTAASFSDESDLRQIAQDSSMTFDYLSLLPLTPRCFEVWPFMCVLSYIYPFIFQ